MFSITHFASRMPFGKPSHWHAHTYKQQENKKHHHHTLSQTHSDRRPLHASANNVMHACVCACIAYVLHTWLCVCVAHVWCMYVKTKEKNGYRSTRRNTQSTVHFVSNIFFSFSSFFFCFFACAGLHGRNNGRMRYNFIYWMIYHKEHNANRIFLFELNHTHTHSKSITIPMKKKGSCWPSNVFDFQLESILLMSS